MARHQYNFRITKQLRVIQQRHPVSVGQSQVEQDDIRLLQSKLPPGIVQGLGGGGGKAFIDNQGRHHPGRIRIVLDDQSVSHRSPWKLRRRRRTQPIIIRLLKLGRV